MFWLLLILAAVLLLPFAGSAASLWWQAAKPWFVAAQSGGSKLVKVAGSQWTWAVVSLAVGFVVGRGSLAIPSIDWPAWVNVPSVVVPVEPAKVTAVTYIYEKDQGEIPSTVAVALDKLNRQGILATKFEEDTTDASGNVPAQYVIAKAEATKTGLPALVVQSGDIVVRIVKAPTTEQQVLEATK